MGTTPMKLLKDTKIGDYNIRKDTELIVNFYGLHYNTSQWQRPKEFLPERFDQDSPLFLAPNGKKRHPNSYAPFSGGKRVCFGKTFAEVSLKMIATYMTQYFDFVHVDEKYRSKDCYPMTHFGMGGLSKPIMLRLTSYTGFND